MPDQIGQVGQVGKVDHRVPSHVLLKRKKRIVVFKIDIETYLDTDYYNDEFFKQYKCIHGSYKRSACLLIRIRILFLYRLYKCTGVHTGGMATSYSPVCRLLRPPGPISLWSAALVIPISNMTLSNNARRRVSLSPEFV